MHFWFLSWCSDVDVLESTIRGLTLRCSAVRIQIINYMAANNLLLNQDRCTKNFYIYRDAITERWSILPWDTESAMGISSGLGGVPAPDYCVLVCEQWNSPLYCDSDHPQVRCRSLVSLPFAYTVWGFASYLRKCDLIWAHDVRNKVKFLVPPLLPCFMESAWNVVIAAGSKKNCDVDMCARRRKPDIHHAFHWLFGVHYNAVSFT